MTKIALIVPTLNAGERWRDWLDALGAQTLRPDLLLAIDSSSSDDTAAMAVAYGFEVRVIRQEEFNHGATRQRAVDSLPGDVGIVVFLTQDTLLASPNALAELIESFDNEAVAAAYGRQLPHTDAGPIGSHARLFNYPAVSQIRSYEDRKQHGIKTAFISNSFAAYRREALAAVGGFPTNVIMNEDTYAAGRMLLAGWKIAYRADAEVHHSHDYGHAEEFRRYFDIGVFHARNPWLRQRFGEVGGEGRRYVLSELAYLARHAPRLIPSALLRSGLKWLGYTLGSRWHTRLPLCLKKRCSLHRGYWKTAGALS